MKCRILAEIFLSMLVVCMVTGSSQARRIMLPDEYGQPTALYAESHALVVGVSDYTGDWPDLPSVSQDVETVTAILEAHGFQVETLMNPPDYAALDEGFRTFINTYGQQFDNRLLFYFAGHGETRVMHDEREMGYLVAADAPFLSRDETGFLEHALDMATIAGYAKRIQAKHALFIFDSCFAGSIFDNTRGAPEEISYKTRRPVRQFITSGSKDEQVPDQSIFRQKLVDALQGEGDVDGDGYITGAELGYFLDKAVVKYSQDGQHPQYGKILDPTLDKGDFVFQLPEEHTPPFSLDELETIAAMEEAFAWVREFEERKISLDLKIAAWQKFLHNFRRDLLSSTRDDDLRQLAQDQLAYWQGQKEPTTTLRSIKLPPPPTPFPAREATPNLSETGQLLGESCFQRIVPTDPATLMEFVWIPGGCFQMGQTETEKQNLIKEVGEDAYHTYFADEPPRHEVCVEGFWMTKYEVTNRQYRQWKKQGIHDSGNYKEHSLNGDMQPVVNVSWDEADAFARWLTKQHENEYTFRLPTEAEWEYAARAGTTTSRFWSDEPNDACQYANVADQTAHHQWSNWTIHHCDDGYAVSAPVGSIRPNAFHLYDMLGNVWEWCHEKNYSGADRVLRGGSWFSLPAYVRSAARFINSPTYRNGDVGFRLVRTD